MKKIIFKIIILINSNFAQSGGKFLDNYLGSLTAVVSMSHSYYGKEWNEFIALLEAGGGGYNIEDLNQNPFRQLNFTILTSYKNSLLVGVKFLNHGYDYNYTNFLYSNDLGLGVVVNSKLELKFLKLFLTYPLFHGFYLGFEGGYFIEGESKLQYRNGTNYIREFQRYEWKNSDTPSSGFDYGILGQFYYNINKNMLVTVEGYYGLSKFTKDYVPKIFGNPNVFHYVNLGTAYKFGKK